MRRTALVLIVIATLQSIAVAADVMHRLNDREITARLTGMEITDEYHWAYVFWPCGQVDVLLTRQSRYGKLAGSG